MAPVGTNMRRLGTIEKEAFWGDYVWSHIDAYRAVTPFFLAMVRGGLVWVGDWACGLYLRFFGLRFGFVKKDVIKFTVVIG